MYLCKKDYYYHYYFCKRSDHGVRGAVPVSYNSWQCAGNVPGASSNAVITTRSWSVEKVPSFPLGDEGPPASHGAQAM